MKPQSCSWKWQIEAARDGRLHGKDLESAQRHQATCTECEQVGRALAALGQRIARLPELTREPLSVRRSRQRLLADLNAAVLARPEPTPAHRAAWLLVLGIVAASWFVVSRHLKPFRATKDPQSIIEVHAPPGTRWSEHQNHQLDRVELVEGTASFTVHPHHGRRVVIQLPDGELEDTGTVFEISVHNQQTKHISVSEGRVLVRLRGRPDFKLGAGEIWESESAPAANAAPERNDVVETHTPTAAEAPAPEPERSTSSSRGTAPARSHSALQIAAPAVLAASEAAHEGKLTASTSNTREAKAEDDAYLQIVELLRQAQYGAARAQAKSYLLRFPNGFRRIEVLNIATRAADDTTGGSASH